MRFLSQVNAEELIGQPITPIQINDTSPSVLNRTRLTTKNTVSVNITNFRDGQEGQEIKVLGDSFTNVVNGTFIKTNTGSNKLLLVNKVYTFTLFAGVWIENG